MSAVDLEARRALATQLLEAARRNACPFLGAVDDETRRHLETQFSGVDPHDLSRVELRGLAKRHGLDVEAGISRLEETGSGMDGLTGLVHGRRVTDTLLQTNEMHSMFDTISLPLEEETS